MVPDMETTTPADSPSVLLSFKAGNVRSFREEFKLDLLATALAEPTVRRAVTWRQGGSPVDVLPAAGIFGANASGKTNVLRAMDDLRSLVVGSFRSGRPSGGVPRRPFLLDDDSVRQPSKFEVDLVLHGIRHQYGLTIDKERVLDEWAVNFPKGRSTLLFSRNMNELEYGATDRSKSRTVAEILRPNALFLSTAASANHPLLLPLYNWFERNFLLAEAQSRGLRQLMTAQMLQDERLHEQVLTFLREADLGITDAAVEEVDPEFRDRMKRAVAVLLEDARDEVDIESAVELAPGIHLTHQGERSRPVQFNAVDESHGTMVWLGIVGPVIHALRNGSVLLADELDASLHPVLVAHVVALFQDPETNPRRAQVIFNSHDTTLLGDSAGVGLSGGRTRLLGRDQVWFTEKENNGATRLYPLSDLSPRKDEAVERRYISGRYGAVPIVAKGRVDAAVKDALSDYATR